MKDPIVVVGAGLAGLAAALELEAHGESCIVLERDAHIGGKLETSIVDDSYLLDRGFQVLLPAYPELRRYADLESALDLKFFNSGARLELPNTSLTMANPLLHPTHLLSTTFGAYGSLRDKLLVAKLAASLFTEHPDALLTSAEGSTLDYLRDYGFSERMIESFWQPFFSGIFLERELATAAGFFRYLTRMFASSPVAVPRLGVGELPKYLAAKLQRSEIRLSTSVRVAEGEKVELESGEKLSARAVLSDSCGHTGPANTGPFGAVTSCWFKAPEAPYEGAWLSLNAKQPTKDRLINHVAVLSNVSRDYAAKGDALICASVVGQTSGIDMRALLVEAEVLYGKSVRDWVLLRTDEINRPFPLYLNRTDSDTPSQQGALQRGRRAAKLALSRLK